MFQISHDAIWIEIVYIFEFLHLNSTKMSVKNNILMANLFLTKIAHIIFCAFSVWTSSLWVKTLSLWISLKNMYYSLPNTIKNQKFDRIKQFIELSLCQNSKCLSTMRDIWLGLEFVPICEINELFSSNTPYHIVYVACLMMQFSSKFRKLNWLKIEIISDNVMCQSS